MSHGGRETQSLASTVSMAFGVILYTTESLRIAPSIHWIAKHHTVGSSPYAMNIPIFMKIDIKLDNP